MKRTRKATAFGNLRPTARDGIRPVARLKRTGRLLAVPATEPAVEDYWAGRNFAMRFSARLAA